MNFILGTFRDPETFLYAFVRFVCSVQNNYRCTPFFFEYYEKDKLKTETSESHCFHKGNKSAKFQMNRKVFLKHYKKGYQRGRNTYRCDERYLTTCGKKRLLMFRFASDPLDDI